MKKIFTQYKLTDDVTLVQNEEYKEHICLIEYGEFCSGILKHWGNKDDIILELENIIKILKEYKNLKLKK